eukprot:28412-Hanusia_phi.AAC.2
MATGSEQLLGGDDLGRGGSNSFYHQADPDNPGQLRCYEVDASTGKTKPIGMQKHEKPAMCCAWKLDGSGVLSGGADGKGMLWDIRAGTWTQAMDVVDHVMIVATAERHVLQSSPAVSAEVLSFEVPNPMCGNISRQGGTGFCVGSIEGRVGVEHISDADLPKNFAFKCHRQNTNAKDPELYAINTIAFHPVCRLHHSKSLLSPMLVGNICDSWR